MLDVVHDQLLRCTLEQNETAALGHRNGCTDEHEADEQADGRVGVKAIRRCALPNGYGGYNDAHIVHGVA
jgi:hypothetical protein